MITDEFRQQIVNYLRQERLIKVKKIVGEHKDKYIAMSVINTAIRCSMKEVYKIYDIVKADKYLPYNLNELQRDELFLGNVNISEFPEEACHQYKTIRMGEQAYDANGQELPKDKIRPLFIQECEYDSYYEQIRDEIKFIN